MTKDRSNLISGEQVAAEDMKIIGSSVGKGINRRMAEQNLDAKQLSELSKVHEESIVQIVEGKRMISIGESKKIAHALHCSAREIIEGE